ncbi:uncharacterized protein LOC143030874 [Oratosquilla oratoria]|uniref:uncharacterized protein LOC143030874 n=1 Tax=Oratosquilla oratoria TaxID=337810 RepID=UPI003F7649C5
MAGRARERPTYTPRSTHRRVLGGSQTPQTPTALEQAHRLLLAQTDAIVSLQQQLAARPAQTTSVSRSSAPEKCDMDMSTAAFRSWRRSMQCWLDLNGWAPTEAVLYIRLHCTPPLQRSLDARFTAAEWQALTVKEALDSVSGIALQATNQAADWCRFFTARQERNEPISEYFTRSAQCAADCEFKCPHCDSSLSEYMLLRKLVSGLESVGLKEEVFRKCDSFKDTDSLRKFCVAFEAAHKDAAPPGLDGNLGRETLTPTAAVTPQPCAPQEDLQPQVAGNRPPPHKPHCGNCGGKHMPRKGMCPAETLTCYGCGKTGHLRRLCRKSKKAAAMEGEASGIVIAAAGKAQSQPCIWVTVSDTRKETSARIRVIPDTGAQVCVAGPGLLAALGVDTTSLVSRGSLRDVANVSLKPMGAVTCRMQHGSRFTTQEVFVVKTASRCYISLQACKDLGLVHPNFPHQPAVAASAAPERKFKCVDDTLLYDASVEDAFWHTYDFLETCAMKGVTLKPEKFRFCRRQVDFVGFHVGWDAYKPTEERLAAIRNFDMPVEPSITDIRSWHGFVNQLAPFLATAPVMEPFRELLRRPQGRKVYWDENLQEKFRQAKEVVCKLAKEGLTYYDKDRPTVVVTDWSKVGIGFVILQQYCPCPLREAPFCCKSGWRLALCGSRHLTPAEAGYAPVEGEALAVAWCLRKARLFLLGCPNLLIITDHRPLVKLLGDRELKDIVNPRLFALKEKTLQYRFQIKYLPGKRNSAADFLSRYPALCAPPDVIDEELANDMEAAVAAATVAVLDSDDQIALENSAVVQAAADDPDYQLLIAKVTAGDWHPQRAQELTCLRQFYGVRDRLAVSQGLVTYTYEQGAVRLVVPAALRHRVAANLHASHQGLDGMLRRARQAVYWPGMEGDLQHHRDTCASCNTHSPSQAAEPLTLTPPPQYPFQHTVADLFQLDGRVYLAYADRLTGWLEIAHLTSGATSSKLSSTLRQYFHRWGAPESISTDGGTNLTSEEMRNFFGKWE